MAQQYDLEITVRTKKEGRGVQDAEKEMNALGESSSGLNTRMVNLAAGLSVAEQAFGLVSGAAQTAYGVISEGAQLQRAESQFGNLAKSIDTTAEALLTDLKRATNGMVSDAELIAGATDIINLGLGSTQEETVRLATAVSTLGLDMQQVILTFANNSTARLDALGLSVEGVTQKAKELERQGFQGDAFDEAVLIGLEEKMELLGDASETTAGKLQRLEAAWDNLSNKFKTGAATALEPAISNAANLTDQMGQIGDAMDASEAPITNVAVVLNELTKALGGVAGDDIVENIHEWETGTTAAERAMTDYVDTIYEAEAAARRLTEANIEAERKEERQAEIDGWGDYTAAIAEAEAGARRFYEGQIEAEARLREETQQRVSMFQEAASLTDPLLEAQQDLAEAQGEWVQATVSSAGQIERINAQLAGDLTGEQKSAYQEIVNTVEEGSAEWLAAYNALQSDLTDSQRQELIAQRADLEARGDTAVSVYTGDAEAAEEAQRRIEEAQAAIQESYRQSAFETTLAAADTSAEFERALEAGIAMGAITQEQADIQQSVVGTQKKVDELVEVFNSGSASLDPDAYAAAFRTITTSARTSVDEAIALAQEQQATTQALIEGGASGIGDYYRQQAEAGEAETGALSPEVDTTEATAKIDEMTGQLEEVTTTEWVAPVDADTAGAKSALEALKDQLENIEGPFTARVNVSTSGGGGGATSPSGATRPNIPGFARGADFIVPSGFRNDSFLMGVTSGERVTVTPHGEQRDGGYVDNRQITIVNRSREAAAISMALVQERRRQRLNRSMGV